MSPHDAAAGIDIGGSGARILVRARGATLHDEIVGMTAGAVAQSPDAALERIANRARELAGGAPLRTVAIGVAGLSTHPGSPRDTEDAVRRLLGAERAIVTSDVVTAHLGALDGRPGAVLAAGTGAIALGADGAGTWRRVDGWGHLLGDLGSGAWIGVEALRAAAGHLDGRRQDGAALAEVAAERFGPLRAWPGAIMPLPDRARVLAALVPDVAATAEDDACAAGILDRAAAHLADTLLAALAPGIPERAAIVGGLAEVARITDPLLARVRAGRPAADIVSPQGTPLDGALLLAERLLADPDPLPGHSDVE
ncbi:N-acetylglucosamine kinase [Microbacterium karelineae]|uniref:N-acetylglucosamine kinase n=1 Tax=Microbacterium karelineae TaxID=2654283 RepID=UPI0012EA67A8|nr:BadF/BadG/BcrA/BcrD ATPase family protein [Microbacterium karelineae]